MFKTLYSILIALAAALTVASCTDDRLWDDTEIGEGEAKVTASVSFKNFTPALDGSRAAGTALDGISNLYLFIFNSTDNSFVDRHFFTTGQGGGLHVNQSGNSDKPDGSTGVGESVSTAKATMQFPLPYGKYKIYAVANVPDEYVADLDAISTPEALKSKSFDWKGGDGEIAKNGAMFGVFFNGAATANRADVFDAPEVIVNSTNVSLSAWMRRLASKITVSFNPSGLKEAVTVYIKSVTIHDIASSCTLGKSNAAASKDDLITSGETISFVKEGTDPDDHANWLRLRKVTEGTLGSDHKHESAAMFFYENMQGDHSGDGKAYCKEQDADEMGSIDFKGDQNTPGGDPAYGDWKDKVPFGTYIEVEAYYVSANPEKPSAGPIKYRFMLGKDTKYDYNAERNYHYKLELNFRNWANDPDWHIDYEEPTPGIFTPEEYFISYLYDKTMSMPVRITNIEGIAKIRADIIENNWAPYDPATGGVPSSATPGGDFAWNRDAYNLFERDYSDEEYHGHANFLGFLSLRRTHDNLIGSGNYGPAAMETLKDYYVEHERGWAEYDITSAGTKTIVNDKGRDDDGQYTVTIDGKDAIISVPMWTRAKQMVPMSSFTGNNPYNQYRRKAVVRFTAWDAAGNQVPFKDHEGNDMMYQDVPVFQVRRIENPKAIWRAHNNDAAFDVDLSILETVDATQFTSLPSSGRWRASILVQTDNFISISKDGVTVTKTNKEGDDNNYIYGSTGSYMRFTYKPTGTISVNQSRCGIIMVEYQDYSCVHYIFVRQGYNGRTPLGGKDWSTYNVYAMNGNPSETLGPQQMNASSDMAVVTTGSPLSIGSFFKRGNYYVGFLQSNNITYGPYSPIYNRNLSAVRLSSGSNANSIVNFNVAWNDAGGYGWKSYDGSSDRMGASYSWMPTMKALNLNGEEFVVPTYDDFWALRDCGQGFGVVYGDGATVTAKSVDDAYGFMDVNNNNNGWSSDNGGSGGSLRGIRACVVYDESTGQQIIFPVGVSGQGRRARDVYEFSTIPGLSGSSDTRYYRKRGMLSYSGVYGVLSGDGNRYRPIPYNLYRDPGAVYWIRQPRAGGHISNNGDCASWDINYFSFEFGPYDDATLGDGIPADAVTAISGVSTLQQRKANCSDALPIHLIYK